MPLDLPPSPYVYVALPEHAPRLQRECSQVLLLSQQEQAKAIARQAAAASAKRILTNYSKKDSFDSCLKNFACKALGLSASSFDIKAVEEVGYSGDLVFAIKDRARNRSLGILKVFQESSDNFFPEVFSLNYLTSRGLANFSSPRMRALGRFHYGDNDYFLLCESTAPGSSLLGHYRNGLPFADLERGMKECGRTMAALHRSHRGKPQALSEALEKKTRELLLLAVEKLKAYPQCGIDVEKLAALYEKTLAEMKSEPLPTAVIHGDTKLINVFFEPQTNMVTWIDPPKLYESIDPDGMPNGIPAKDFYSFMADVEHQRFSFLLDENQKVRSKELLSLEQIEKLKKAFSLGYEEGGGKLPTQRQLAFFSLAAHLYFISSDRTRDKNSCIPEPQKSAREYRMKNIYSDVECRLLEQTER